LIKVAASILSCNTAYIGDAVLEAEKGKADIIHMDIMDGHYVKNLTFGPQVLKDIKQITDIPVEVHLEITNAHEIAEVFAQAGADIITVQLDSCLHPIRIFNTIKSYGKKVGVAINPSMSVEQIEHIITHIDHIVLMSVEPGFGGQVFEKSTYKKIRKVKEMIKRYEVDISLGVDGGIDMEIAKELSKAGAEVLIIGSSIFSKQSIVESVKSFKNISQ
jgi:ribulose-phosphate 3-epimerase